MSDFPPEAQAGRSGYSRRGSLEIVTVLPPLITKKGILGGGKTVTVCSKTPKNFGAFGADLTKINGFIPPAGLLPPEAEIF